MASDRFLMSQAVCTRLCHDLGGPVGALSGALELLDGPGDDALEVARDAARIIDRRLRFFRAAIGGVGAELGADEIGQLTEGLTLGRRAGVDLDGMAEGGPVPAAMAQTLLVAIWLAVEALPRGGTVRVAGSGGQALTVWPDGPSSAWPPGLPGALLGEEPPLTPRGVSVPLLMATAQAGRIVLDLLHGAGGGAAPWILTPRPPG